MEGQILESKDVEAMTSVEVKQCWTKAYLLWLKQVKTKPFNATLVAANNHFALHLSNLWPNRQRHMPSRAHDDAILW